MTGLALDADGRAPLPGQLTIAGDVATPLEVLGAVEVLPADGSLSVLANRVAESQASEATRKAYASSYRKLGQVIALQTAGPHDVTAELGIAFRNRLEASKLAPASIARHMSAFRELARAAKAGREVFEVRSPRVEPGEPRGLSPEQAARLLAMPDLRTKIGVRDAVAMHLMLGAGLRAGEVAAALVDDLLEVARLSNGGLRPAVPGATRWIIDVRGKGGRRRPVPLSEPIVDILGRWSPMRPSCDTTELLVRVHRSLPPAPLTTSAIADLVAKHAAAAGLHEITPHMLRHTFATRLGEAGTPLDVISDLLGHQDVRTSLVYTRRSKTAGADAIDAINAEPTGLERIAR